MRDHLIIFSFSHRRALVAVRERLAATTADLPSILACRGEGIEELAVVSTCNRAEFYAVAPAGHCPVRALRRWIAARGDITEDELAAVADVYLDRGAVEHAFRVAAGLDSLVLGEPHILGQLRVAFAVAQQAGAAGPILARLGADALALGKQVRTVTGLARNRATIAHVAVDLAARYLPAWETVTAAVLGAGEIGALTAQILRGLGVARLIVVNRGEVRGRMVARRTGGQYLPLTELPTAAVAADLLVVAAGGADYLVSPPVLAKAAPHDRPLVVVDLGLPRLVDPHVGYLPGVRLLDLDDLVPLAEERRRTLAHQAAMAEALVAAACAEFIAWWGQRAAAPTIAALRQRAERIRDAELARALRRLAHLSERDRNVVAALSVGLVNKLLHLPMTRLREDLDGELSAAACRLFDLAGEVPAAAGVEQTNVLGEGSEQREALAV